MLIKNNFIASQSETCPVCQREARTAEYRYQQGETEAFLYRCEGCQLVFLRPLLLPELDERQMDGIGSAEMEHFSLLKKVYAEFFLKREVARIRKVLGSGELRLLDIGCGTGWMTHLYAEQGFQVVGLEPSSARAEMAARSYGLKVVNDYLENASFDEKFDVIVMRHIVEHFADLNQVFIQIRELLSQGGLLLATVPNVDSLGRLLFEADWSWGLPHHCNFFNPQSLTELLTLQGFKALRLSHSPSPFYMVNSFVRKYSDLFVGKMVANHRPLAMLFASPLPVFASLVGRGDNLNLVACRDSNPEFSV